MVDESNPYEVKNRQIERQRNILNWVGELIQPATLGFDHVNMDMCFTYLGNTDISRIQTLSMCVDITHMRGWKFSEYLLRGQIAAILNSNKSRNAKAMNLFTEVTTNQKITQIDETQQKKGFDFFGFKKKNKEGA